MPTQSAVRRQFVPVRSSLGQLQLLKLFGLLATLFCIRFPAYAAEFVVSTAADAVDAEPGDGICATEAGSCSLRAAIQEANALDGADSVVVPPPPAADRYRLTILGPDEDDAASGDLDVTDDLVLSGEGSVLIIVQGTVTDRVFDVLEPATVRIEKLGIEGGSVALEAGGGIRNRGILTLEAVTLQDNAAADGAGIANVEEGDLEVVNATISGNTATGLGGGIANFDEATASLLNVTVADNEAFQGSGLHNLSTIELQNTILAQKTGHRNCDGRQIARTKALFP
jgi:CSLREA domain-containing protein